jgi:hypothetical protein
MCFHADFKSLISADLALRENKIRSEYKWVTCKSPASSIFDKAIQLHKKLKNGVTHDVQDAKKTIKFRLLNIRKN